MLGDVGVDFYFGGTLFEKFVLQDRFDEFRDLCQSYGCQYVEVSNGTIDLSHIEKAGYVRKLAGEFKVVSEVGFKDSERSERLAPNRWIECIHEDLEAGAFLVTLESRESGRSGICRPNGELRFGLIEEILASDVTACAACSSRRRRPSSSATSCGGSVPTSTSGTSRRPGCSGSRRSGSACGPTRSSASKSAVS